MEYFILTIDSTVKKPIYPLDCKNISKNKILTIQESEGMEYLRISKFNSDKTTEYSDIIINPLYMVSNNLKAIIKENYFDLYTLGVQMLDQNGEGVLYWILALEELDCVSPKTSFNPDGTLKELILDKDIIKYKKIFKISGIFESILIVNLDLAEKMLNSDLYGIFIKKVKVI